MKRVHTHLDEMIKHNSNIAFVIHNITAKGGEERMCSMIANYLQAQGYNISIFSLFSHRGTPSFFNIIEGVKIYHLLGHFIERRIQQYAPWLNYLSRKFRRYIIKYKPDVVIDVDITITPLTTKVILGQKIKHVAWDHFPYGHYNESIPGLLKSLFAVDKIVVLTKGSKRSYVNKAHFASEKIIQIYNPSPIECDTYIPHNNHVVLAMGRLEVEKGFDRLLNIWAKVEPQVPDWVLKIVGSGGYLDALKAQADDLNLHRVFFYPHTASPIEYYKDASIFVLTSRCEGLGLVLIEALNVSLPIVSYDCENGPREIIEDGINGYLIPDGDEKLFVDKLLLLINNESMRNRLSQNAMISTAKFSLKSIGQRWVELLDSI